jgi:hypothetical protein
MNKKDKYVESALAYADGVRTLFAPSGTSMNEQGGKDRAGRKRSGVQGPTSYEDLAKKAEDLSGISDNLGKVIAAQLSAPDPSVRMGGSTRMLAKALTDLEVSAQLLQAAMDEQQKTRFDSSRSAERGVVDLGPAKEYLDILLGEGKGVSRAVERGRKPASIKEARMLLSTSLDDTLTLICDRANRATQSAIGGLLGLGAGELAKAAGALGMSIAEMLGQAEKVSRLYDLFRSFVSKVYDALVALIGESLMQKAGQKVVEFVNEVKGGKYLPEILEALYQTKPTKDELKSLVDGSKAAIEKFNSTIQAVESLNEGYGSQVKLVEKLIKGLSFVGGLSEMIIPQGKLILAAAYVGLGGYVVLAGADYVDSPNIKWLDRVSGVRRTVEGNLKVS